MSLAPIPDRVRDVRTRVERFMDAHVYPIERAVLARGADATALLRAAQAEAKRQGLWGQIGGGGLPFMDYVLVNEVQGRSEIGQLCLGTFTLQDSLMFHAYGNEHQRAVYLRGLVEGTMSPSFAMTEPAVASSDPTSLQTRAVLERDGTKGDLVWVISGRKWFTTNANGAAFTTVMCRTEFDDDVPAHAVFSMIVVPTNTPGYKIVRETPVLGILGGHCEVHFDNVRVPADALLGERGRGFEIAQRRLGPGRIFHCMRWLGQAQRAFDIMCRRLHERKIRGGQTLAQTQLMQQHVFESYCEIQACRMLTLAAAARLDSGDSARVDIAAIKVVGARMLHSVIDRAIQAHGAAGLTDDTPLSYMYRAARFGRIYDGPDEVHVISTARQLLSVYRNGGTWDFAKL